MAIPQSAYLPRNHPQSWGEANRCNRAPSWAPSAGTAEGGTDEHTKPTKRWWGMSRLQG